MTALLEKALEKIGTLPAPEQDAIASELLASLADEEAWKGRLAEKRDRILSLAEEALEDDDQGETRPLEDLL